MSYLKIRRAAMKAIHHEITTAELPDYEEHTDWVDQINREHIDNALPPLKDIDVTWIIAMLSERPGVANYPNYTTESLADIVRRAVAQYMHHDLERRTFTLATRHGYILTAFGEISPGPNDDPIGSEPVGP